jgi:hypothetical protein
MASRIQSRYGVAGAWAPDSFQISRGHLTPFRDGHLTPRKTEQVRTRRGPVLSTNLAHPLGSGQAVRRLTLDQYVIPDGLRCCACPPQPRDIWTSSSGQRPAERAHKPPACALAGVDNSTHEHDATESDAKKCTDPHLMASDHQRSSDNSGIAPMPSGSPRAKMAP